MSISASMLTIVKSGLLFGCELVAVGRLTSIPFMLIIVRLTSMNAASRKNMMSISGMISIRARLIGTGELLWLMCILIRDDVVSITQRVEHQNDVVRGRLELELEPRDSCVEEIEENQRKNGNSQTTCGRDQRFCDATADLSRRQIGSSDEIEGAHNTSDSPKQPQ